MTSTVRVRQKNGDIYVMERKSVYDPDKGYSKPIGSKMLGKIPAGSEEMVPTRPYKRKKPQSASQAAPECRAEVRSAGLAQLLDWIGRESGIDEDLFGSADTGDAQKLLTLARYLFATDGQTLPRIEKWQTEHETPYAEGVTESVYHKLFDEFGLNATAMQSYFRRRAARLCPSATIAFDSTTVSTYSENQKEAEQGFNKAGDGLDTIKLLTLYSAENRQPVAFAKQPGNLPDVTSIRNTLKQLGYLGLVKPVIVADNGYYSLSNIAEFSRDNTKFLMLGDLGAKWIHDELDKHREELEQLSTMCPWDSSVHGITVMTTATVKWQRQRAGGENGAGETVSGDHRYYLHFFLNRARTSHDEIKLHESVVELREQVAKGEKLTEQARRKADRFLLVGRRLKDGRQKVDFNEAAIKEARKDYGYFVLVSNKKMGTFEALENYRLRERIEEAFKVQKERLDGSRPRVWHSRSLMARMFVQFIALGYYSFFQEKLKELKAGLGEPNGDPEHDLKTNLDAETKLKKWMEQRSLTQILDWFDCKKETVIMTPTARHRWTTESTERDRLFLRRLGVI
ncbi:MAG: transposase [Duodenibacillus sp.]|nr:transposase [Duodenibacillus sp.]